MMIKNSKAHDTRALARENFRKPKFLFSKIFSLPNRMNGGQGG